LLLPASLAGPCRPDPPRCCVDLQRLTAVASRFGWLPDPACALLPFGLDPGVFATAATGDCSPGLFAAHGLALTLEDRDLDIVRASRTAHDHRPFDPSCSRGVCRPFDAPSPGDPCPGGPVGASNNSVALVGLTSPRASTPASAACAVSHDLDGLLPPGPGGVFQPLTPLGFGFPPPRRNERWWVVGQHQASGWCRSPRYRSTVGSDPAAPGARRRRFRLPAPQRVLPARPSRRSPKLPSVW
jgi:hypothetical protein